MGFQKEVDSYVDYSLLGAWLGSYVLKKRQKKISKFFAEVSDSNFRALELAYNKITQKRSILCILVFLWLFLKSSLRPY